MYELLRPGLITISAQPLMVLVQAGFGFPAPLNNAISPRINQMQFSHPVHHESANNLLG
jgi:hypothetical protein